MQLPGPGKCCQLLLAHWLLLRVLSSILDSHHAAVHAGAAPLADQAQRALVFRVVHKAQHQLHRLGGQVKEGERRSSVSSAGQAGQRAVSSTGLKGRKS